MNIKLIPNFHINKLPIAFLRNSNSLMMKNLKSFEEFNIMDIKVTSFDIQKVGNRVIICIVFVEQIDNDEDEWIDENNISFVVKYEIPFEFIKAMEFQNI